MPLPSPPPLTRNDTRKVPVDADVQNEESFAARVCGVNVLANALHYHDANRHQAEVIPGGVETLVKLSDAAQPTAMREAALRCLVSLAATDRGARRVLEAPGCAALLAAVSDVSEGDRSSRVRRYAAMALANICLCVEARPVVTAHGGLDVLVSASACSDPEAQKAATLALDALKHSIGREAFGPLRIAPTADAFGAKALVEHLAATPASQLAGADDDEAQAPEAAKAYFETERLRNADLAAERSRTMAARCLEEGSDWLRPSNLEAFFGQGGIEALFKTLEDYSFEDKRDGATKFLRGGGGRSSDLFLATLEAIYNCLRYAEPRDLPQQRVSNLRERGLPLLLALAKTAATSQQGPAAKVLETALRCLVVAVSDFAPACRSLLKNGLDFLLDLAEGEDEPATAMPAVAAIHKDIAAVLLRTLAPFNRIFCPNCETSNRGGLVCVYCGHPLLSSREEETDHDEERRAAQGGGVSLSSSLRKPATTKNAMIIQ